MAMQVITKPAARIEIPKDNKACQGANATARILVPVLKKCSPAASIPMTLNAK